MGNRLRTEHRQRRPFASLEQETVLALRRTGAVLEHAFAETLRPHGITPTQFNVLRILRGAGPGGLCRNDLRDRLIAPVPDATRLLDRMVDLGLVSRDRDGQDRRYVTARITEQGLAVLASLDQPIEQLHRDLMGHLEPADMRALIGLLDQVRAGSVPDPG